MPQQSSKPSGGFPERKEAWEVPDTSEDVASTGTTDAPVDAVSDELSMAPLRRRALAQVYDNLELGIYLSASVLIFILFLKLWFYLSKPSSLQEFNTTMTWVIVFLIVFLVAVIYYLQVYIPYQHGRTHGQKKYGLSLEKAGPFTHGTFILRALGQSLNMTPWTYIFVQAFRRNAPGNDEIRGLEDIFSGTRQVVFDRIDGKPVKGLLAILSVIVIIILSIVFAIGLMQSSVEKSRREEYAKSEAFKERRSAVLGFDDINAYVEKVDEARRSCSDGACVSNYEEYKTAYLNPIKEMGREADDIFLYYSKLARGSLVLDRISDEAARRTVELMFFNGVCYRKELFKDKLLTEDTFDGFKGSLFRSRRVSIKEIDSKCPVRDLSGLQ